MEFDISVVMDHELFLLFPIRCRDCLTRFVRSKTGNCISERTVVYTLLRKREVSIIYVEVLS